MPHHYMDPLYLLHNTLQCLEALSNKQDIVNLAVQYFRILFCIKQEIQSSSYDDETPVYFSVTDPRLIIL